MNSNLNTTAVKLENVTKSFQQGEKQIGVLKNINLEIKSGESLAILGQSGSGKTTLLTLIAGLDKPDSGQVTVLNQDIMALNEDDLSLLRRKRMSIVFQQFHLFKHLTALENVLLSLELAHSPDAEKKAKDMLMKVGLGHRIDHFPSQLSGGECQRLAIARALVTEPEVVLADEPSGNLDQSTGDQVMKLIFDLVKEKNLTLILVTHNKDLALLCHRSFNLTHSI